MATKSTRVHFNCPHCNALYRIVKVEVGPETITDEWVTCRNCAGRLPTRDGNSVIKYFLLRKLLAPYGPRGGQALNGRKYRTRAQRVLKTIVTLRPH